MGKKKYKGKIKFGAFVIVVETRLLWVASPGMMTGKGRSKKGEDGRFQFFNDFFAYLMCGRHRENHQ